MNLSRSPLTAVALILLICGSNAVGEEDKAQVELPSSVYGNETEDKAKVELPSSVYGNGTEDKAKVELPSSVYGNETEDKAHVKLPPSFLKSDRDVRNSSYRYFRRPFSNGYYRKNTRALEKMEGEVLALKKNNVELRLDVKRLLLETSSEKEAKEIRLEIELLEVMLSKLSALLAKPTSNFPIFMP